MDDYEAGNIGQAREEFNQALSVLLQSKYSVRDNDRLAEEFNVLTDNISQVEQAAISQGTPLSPHQYVPTPMESFSGLTFAPNAATMGRIRQEMLSIHSDIPLVTNQSVSGAIAYLTEHARGYIASVLKRLGRYGPMISKTLAKEGLPQDLKYLPGPESAFNPQAVSRKWCVGLWQLEADTARDYGLTINRTVDEREDPFKSTVVATRDLKSLYQEFGDWYLALAAYDSGPVTVQRAIQSTGYADYWTLRRLHVLPPETENYVPVFLATALIAKDPAAYGFNVDPDPPLHAVPVSITIPTDLRLVAGLVNCSPDKLRQLNPDLHDWVTPAGVPNFTLNVPAGSATVLTKQLALVPGADRRWWRAQTVRPGDTLQSVALRYHISEEKLASANQLSLSDSLVPGSHLLIPLAPEVSRWDASLRAPAGWVRRPFYFRVRRGDTLSGLAEHFRVTVDQLRLWNHLRGSRLIAGNRMLVYRLEPRRESRFDDPRDSSARDQGPFYYRVRRGDTLSGLAERYRVTIDQLRRWNHLRGSRLIAGSRLLIYR